MAWAKGQTGNPNGRPKGRRERITNAFLRDLERLWRLKGADVLARAAEEKPAEVAAIFARLLPRDVQHNHLHELSSAFQSALRSVNAALPTTSSPVTVIDMTADKPDEGKSLIPLDTQRSKDIP